MRLFYPSVNWSHLVGIPGRVASPNAPHIDSWALDAMPWLVALDGEDPLDYASRVAAAVTTAAAAASTAMAIPVESTGEGDGGEPEP